MIHVSGVSCLKALTMMHPPPPEFSWIAVMVFPSQKKNSAIIHFSCRLRSLRPFGVQCIPSFKKWTRFHIWLFPKSFFLFDRLILGFRSNDGLNYITLSLILRVPVKKNTKCKFNTWILQPSIFFHLSNSESWQGWSLSQLSQGEMGSTCWTGCKSVIELVQRERQPFMPTDSLESPINLACMWTVGGSWSTWRKTTQAYGDHTNYKKRPQPVRGFEPRSLLLWGTSTNHCTAVPPSLGISSRYPVFVCHGIITEQASPGHETACLSNAQLDLSLEILGIMYETRCNS